jgi:hypothetical protein
MSGFAISVSKLLNYFIHYVTLNADVKASANKLLQ